MAESLYLQVPRVSATRNLQVPALCQQEVYLQGGPLSGTLYLQGGPLSATLKVEGGREQEVKVARVAESGESLVEGATDQEVKVEGGREWGVPR